MTDLNTEEEFLFVWNSRFNVMKIIPFGKASVTDIEALEKRIHHTLPDDYRAFLLENNGGDVHDALFHIHEVKEDILFQAFIGFNVKPALDLNFWIGELEGEAPNNSLLIGKDPGG